MRDGTVADFCMDEVMETGDFMIGEMMRLGDVTMDGTKGDVTTDEM